MEGYKIEYSLMAYGRMRHLMHELRPTGRSDRRYHRVFLDYDCLAYSKAYALKT